MRCAEIEHELGCFIDDELAAPERREVENHLALCQACRELVNEQRQLKQQLRQSLAQTASPVLSQRLAHSLDREDSRQRWARFRPGRDLGERGAAHRGGAFALVLGYVQTVEPLITDSLVKHQRNLPLEVTGGREQVQNWFDGKVPFAVPALRLSRWPRCAAGASATSAIATRPCCSTSRVDAKSRSLSSTRRACICALRIAA